MILHTVNKHGSALLRALAVVSENDAVLLLEDGVYALLETQGKENCWSVLPASVRRFVLVDDLAARGISDKMLTGFEKVDWQGFVDLSTEHDKVVSWG